jgi:hypothetical protein
MPRTPWTRWKVRLTGLEPGTKYSDQVRYLNGAEEEKSQTHQFVTLDPSATETKVADFNDIHDHRETV